MNYGTSTPTLPHQKAEIDTICLDLKKKCFPSVLHLVQIYFCLRQDEQEYI